MKIEDLKPNPRNPREISAEALDALRASIRELGDISGIVYNERLGHLTCGHQRVEALQLEFGDALALEDGAILTPRGDRFPIRVVKWDASKDALANFAANNPHLMGTFTADAPIMLDEIKVEFPELSDELRFPELTESLLDDVSGANSEVTEAGDDIYTHKIITPIYEPKGEKPAIETLIDRTKTEELLAEIYAANLPQDIEHFLCLAAERHTAFHFRRIAEFYCHSDMVTQDLMEKSGLIIIDFKKAIEYGFVHLTERLGELADMEEIEYGDA